MHRYMYTAMNVVSTSGAWIKKSLTQGTTLAWLSPFHAKAPDPWAVNRQTPHDRCQMGKDGCLKCQMSWWYCTGLFFSWPWDLHAWLPSPSSAVRDSTSVAVGDCIQRLNASLSLEHLLVRASACCFSVGTHRKLVPISVGSILIPVTSKKNISCISTPQKCHRGQSHFSGHFGELSSLSEVHQLLHKSGLT